MRDRDLRAATHDPTRAQITRRGLGACGDGPGTQRNRVERGFFGRVNGRFHTSHASCDAGGFGAGRSAVARAYVRRNEGALDALGETSGACHAAVVDALRESFTRCASARGGSWIPEITAIETTPEGARGDHCALTVRWRLVALTYDTPVEETPRARAAKHGTRRA